MDENLANDWTRASQFEYHLQLTKRYDALRWKLELAERSLATNKLTLEWCQERIQDLEQTQQTTIENLGKTVRSEAARDAFAQAVVIARSYGANQVAAAISKKLQPISELF